MIAFKMLPLIVRIATFMSFFFAWVLFAELVIDRYGLDRYLPYYEVADVCVYEMIVGALLLLGWLRAHRG